MPIPAGSFPDYLKIIFFLALYGLSAGLMAQDDIEQDFRRDSFHGFTQHYEKGKALANRYHFREAIAQLEICHEQQPRHTGVLELLGDCHYRLGRYKEARGYYRDILKRQPDQIEALSRLATIATKTGDYPEARRLYDHLLKLDSTNSYYYKQMGNLYLQPGMYDKGTPYFEKALQYNPDDLAGYIALCKIHYELENFNALDSLTEQGLALAPENSKLLRYQLKYQFDQQAYGQIIEEMPRLLRHADTLVNDAKMMGVSLYNTEAFGKAIPWLKRVLAVHPDLEVVHYYLGASYGHVDSLEQSTHHLQKALEHGISGHIDGYYQALGEKYRKQDQYTQALMVYRNAYRMTEDPIFLYYQARCYDEYYRDKKPALAYYEKYVNKRDSAAREIYGKFARHRISQIKETLHFQGERVN